MAHADVKVDGDEPSQAYIAGDDCQWAQDDSFSKFHVVSQHDRWMDDGDKVCTPSAQHLDVFLLRQGIPQGATENVLWLGLIFLWTGDHPDWVRVTVQDALAVVEKTLDGPLHSLMDGLSSPGIYFPSKPSSSDDDELFHDGTDLSWPARIFLPGASVSLPGSIWEGLFAMERKPPAYVQRNKTYFL